MEPGQRTITTAWSFLEATPGVCGNAEALTLTEEIRDVFSEEVTFGFRYEA